ncbi:hypothetical protein T8K17_15935 [Thalassobaculum sp. OXR-137]|uniref:hypothetical protein n=1 Tax=Thalassobaculum sp. OXR-137 TaxID=3100173 RepID=UPI002AC9A9E5|nr:hypothetical protein [Thalassobaculum sp. OXR-137]WPZ32730.1 hypothetical protein T8K17_15935 [Thalassobaculum sp. OXR-137]
MDPAHADIDRALALNREAIGAYGLKNSVFMEPGRCHDALALTAECISVRPSAVAFEMRGIKRIPTGNVAGGQSDYG